LRITGTGTSHQFEGRAINVSKHPSASAVVPARRFAVIALA
jgi:hypothetical protein